MSQETNLIFKIKGGSHAYGLQTPDSDIDWRGVFLVDKIQDIIGLNCGNVEQRQDKSSGKDYEYYELRHFFRLLRAGNSQAVEMLFDTSPDAFIHPWVVPIISNRHSFVDSHKLIKVIKGYSQGEFRLAVGERTGQLGSKRKLAIEEFGFSPKNFCNLLRILWCGKVFYDCGIYPVKVSEFSQEFHIYLFDIKTYPQNHTLLELTQAYKAAQEELEKSFSKTKINFSFNEELANQIVANCYIPFLTRTPF